jgi:hypothetical protein
MDTTLGAIPRCVGVNPGHNQKQQTKLGATQPQADQRGTQKTPLVVDMVQHPKSPEETAETKAEKKHKAFIDGWTLGIAGLVALFTGILVMIGWRGVNAAKRTLMVIERQANLMQEQNIEARAANAHAAALAQGNLRALEAQGRLMARQAALIRASMTQWVLVTNWKTEIVPLPKESKLKQSKRLLIEFDITNESDLPVAMRTTFVFAGALPNKAEFHTEPGVTLFPGKPYNAQVRLNLTEDQLRQYIKGGELIIAVQGDINLFGGAGQNPLMRISGNLVCGKSLPARLQQEQIVMIPTGKQGA